MSKFISLCGFIILFTLALFFSAFAQATTEQLVISTYYPSPYGSYADLTANRMKIGTTYSGVGTAFVNNSLLVEGSVGIGIPVPATQLHTSGTVRFANFGAGTATFDASGNVSSVSDERLKKIEGNFTRGIESLRGIQPIIYKWSEKSGLETEHEYVGFSAQNVQESIPEGTGRNKDGFLSLQDRAIVATLVNAVKEQQDEIQELKMEIQRLRN